MSGVSSYVKQGKHVGNCMGICREGVLSVSPAVQQKLRLQDLRLQLQLIPQLQVKVKIWCLQDPLPELLELENIHHRELRQWLGHEPNLFKHQLLRMCAK